jgi:P4 family phage/plasmid primase-like protien
LAIKKRKYVTIIEENKQHRLQKTMIGEAKELLKLGLIPISCNKNKIPCQKEWTKITKKTCIDKLISDQNIGILTGKISNVTVIDVDVKDDGLKIWKKLTKKHGEIQTPKVKTGSGGIHYYCKYTNKLKSDSKVIQFENKNGIGIDVKNDGGYVVCPPSINKESHNYEWILHPSKTDIAEIPEWFYSYLKDKNTKNINNTKSKSKKTINAKEIDVVECGRPHDKQHIEKILNILSQERVDNETTWFQVGLCLFNSERSSNEYFSLWKEWSKKSTKYNEGDCEKKWLTFKKDYDGNKLTLGSLHEWAKKDNLQLYDKIKKQDCIHKFLEENHDTLSIDESNIEISNVITNPVKCMADLTHNYCLLSKSDHEEPQNYIELIKKDGGAYIACKNIQCDGKILKDQMIPIDEKTMKILFDNSKNITIIGQVINNYGDINEEAEMLICDNYEIFEDKILNGFVMESLNNTPYDIAKVLWHLYKNEYNCTENKIWYRFTSHRWMRDSVDLSETISNDLPKIYKTVLKYYKNLLKNNNDETNNKNINFKIKKITELIKSLKRSCSKNNIIMEASRIFYANNKTFEQQLDSDIHLLGFNNGVYDIKKHEFREGKPEDCITMTTGYDYISTHSEHKIELDKFLEDIQPNETERNYMITYFSLSLIGINTQEIFNVMTGVGRNGKSKFAELLNLTFGNYFETISASLLTKEQPSANAPRPELLLLKNKRLVVASEPENNQKMNASFVKLLTGNDPVTARNLYDNDIITFIPKFNLTLLCNDIPAFDKNDEAIWDRARCIEFPIKFTNNPQGKNQKQIDYKLKEKLVNWNQDFMLMLIDKYKEYEKNGLKTTENVMKFTTKTKEENDIFKQHLDDNTKESDKHVHTSALYDDFKIWFVTNYPKKTIPSNKEYVKEIKKYVEVHLSVKSNGKSMIGVKNLQLIN